MQKTTYYVKCPEKANLQRQKADQQLLGACREGDGGQGLTTKGPKGSFWGDGNVLKLNCGDSSATL